MDNKIIPDKNFPIPLEEKANFIYKREKHGHSPPTPQKKQDRSQESLANRKCKKVGIELIKKFSKHPALVLS